MKLDFEKRDYAERKAIIEQAELPRNLGALLDEAAKECPARQALVFFENDESYTYAELQERVTALAASMREAGLEKGTHAGVMLPNIGAFPITWLALAKIGAVMVPINVAYTPRELDYVIETADVTWLFTHQENLPKIEGMTPALKARLENRTVVVGRGSGNDSFEDWMQRGAGKAPSWEDVTSDDLLNIQFTSGTTGFPKGAMLSQGYWLLSGMQNAFRDGQRYERILASTPFFYMDPQWQMLMTFYQRGTLYVARRQSGSRYMDWIRRFRINFGLLPEIVIKQPPHPDDANNDLKRVNVYGLSKDLHHEIERRFGLRAREAYGMTEIGTGLFMPLEREDKSGSGSCGVPAPFRDVRIVGENGEELAAGEVGELQVRGKHILKGYYKNESASKDAFAGEWFRTGDLFRKDNDGFYTIVGRLKDMIRRAGENISAREVESVLLTISAISEAAVVPVKDSDRGEEVKALIVLADMEADTTAELPAIIDACCKSLSTFKVPRYYQFILELPKTASGKVAKSFLDKGVSSPAHPVYDRVQDRWSAPQGAPAS